MEHYIKIKDFAQIIPFNGDLKSFADWLDRVQAKMAKARPKRMATLEWAEEQTAPITADMKRAVSETEVDVDFMSNAIYDVLM